MKKLIFSLLVIGGLFAVRHASAVDVSNGRPPAITTYGGTLMNRTGIQYGTQPVAQAFNIMPALALTNLNAGDALVLVAGKGVSKTSTAGDTAFIGIAVETTPYNNVAQVATDGNIFANVSVSATVNDRFVTSTTPGYLTTVAAATAANYLSVSGTPIAARAMVTYTYVSYSTQTLVRIGNR